jgi:hypothetical protein
LYKSIEEVTQALDTPIDASQLKLVRGSGGREYSYVPWNITAKLLNTIFGAEGWDEYIQEMHFDSERGIYSVTRTISARAEVGEGENQRIVTITRTGVGVGIVNGDHSLAHDTAIKAADSDSFSRAAKKFGPALGLNLYDKDDPANQTTGATMTRPTVAGTVPTGSRPPSAAQMRFLASLGYTDADVATMDFATWKAVLDNKTQKPGTTPKPRGGRVSEAEYGDGIPF